MADMAASFRDVLARARPGTVFETTSSVAAVAVDAADTTAQARRNRTRRKNTRQRFPLAIVVIVVVVVIVVDLLFHLLLSAVCFVMDAVFWAGGSSRRRLRIGSSFQWSSGVE
jgi:hypothetical protein